MQAQKKQLQELKEQTDSLKAQELQIIQERELALKAKQDAEATQIQIKADKEKISGTKKSLMTFLKKVIHEKLEFLEKWNFILFFLGKRNLQRQL